MAGPITEFDADECQALLDFIERLMPIGVTCPGTDEELAVIAKLREAGKFYVPED